LAIFVSPNFDPLGCIKKCIKNVDEGSIGILRFLIRSELRENEKESPPSTRGENPWLPSSRDVVNMAIRRENSLFDTT
jgi:hypothetical protein